MLRRFSVALFFCSLLVSASINPKVLKTAKKDLKSDVDAVNCLECEAVIFLFQLLNNHVFGGEGEEKLREKVLVFCEGKDLLKKFCDEVKDGNLWDTIYKALRDSLEAFYNIVGVQILGCPDVDTVRKNCEAQ